MKKMDIFLTYIVPALVILGVIATAVKTHLTDKESNEKQKEIKSLTEENLTLSSSIKDISSKVQEIAEKVEGITKNIDNTTKQNRALSEKVKFVVDELEVISKDIKEEQKNKGEFAVLLPKKNKYEFLFGNNSFEFSKTKLKKRQIINFQGLFSDLFVKVEDSKLLITTNIRDVNGDIIAEIKDSKFSLNPNKISSRNFDSNALEIIDKSGDVIFQVEILEGKIIIKGNFHSANGNSVLVSDAGYSMTSRLNNPNFLNEVFIAKKGISRIFEHTGSNYLGSRIPEDELVVRRKQARKVQSLLQNELRVKKSNEKLLIGYEEMSNKELKEVTVFLINELQDLNASINKNNQSKYDIHFYTNNEFNSKYLNKIAMLKKAYDKRLKKAEKFLKSIAEAAFELRKLYTNQAIIDGLKVRVALLPDHPNQKEIPELENEELRILVSNMISEIEEAGIMKNNIQKYKEVYKIPILIYKDELISRIKGKKGYRFELDNNDFALPRNEHLLMGELKEMIKYLDL